MGGIVLAAIISASSAFGQGNLSLSSTAVQQDGAGAFNFTFPSPNVSMADYTTVSVTFNAPTGYAFKVDAGTGTTYMYLDFKYGDGVNWLACHEGLGFIDWVPGMSTLEGSAPIYLLSGNALGTTVYEAEYQWMFQRVSEFRSLGFEFTVNDLCRLPLAQFNSASFQANPMVSLVPIPEPCLAGFIMLALAALGWRFRNQPKAMIGLRH
jgi:hypothetical protein